MLHVAGVVLMMAGLAGAPEEPAPHPRERTMAQQSAPRTKRPLLPGQILKCVEAPGLKVFHFPTPLVGGLAEAFQEGNENVRLTHVTWPFARLETSVPFSLEGTRLVPGNYALILVPSRGGQPMVIEVRRVPPGEFMIPGALQVPAGETVARLAGKGTPASSVAGAFTIGASPRPGGGVALTFHYGEWQATKELLP